MTDAMHPLLEWLNANPNWAGLVTFIISGCESVAIIGTIVPGSITMTAVGALAGAGVIPLWATLIYAILGAIAGDGISYYIGHTLKSRIRNIWPFRKNAEWLDKGENFFHKHGRTSVFIGRFAGPVRAIVPVVAGIIGMKPVSFFSASIPAAILWAPAYMLPGLLFGAVSLELRPDIAVHILLMLLLNVLFIIFCIWIVIKTLVLIGYNIDRMLSRVWHTLQTTKYSKFITVILKHHDTRRSNIQLVLAFYFVLACIGFAWLATEVANHGSPSFVANSIAFHFFRGLRSPIGDNVMLFITMLGDKHLITLLSLLLIGYLFYRKQAYLAWHAFALALLAMGSVEGFKHLVHSSRPWGIQASPDGFSFPSGHTTLATTFYVGYALLLSSVYPSKKRLFIYTAIIIAFLTSISRLYLGAHWFTDVLGGWLLSTALLLLIVISYNRKTYLQRYISGLTTNAMIIFILVYGILCFHSIQHLKKDYALKDYPEQTIPMKQWINQEDNRLPHFRVGRFGLAEEAFNLELLGQLESIKTNLLNNHWETPPERDWISILLRLSDVSSTEYLPLVSPLYEDKKPVLVLIKHTENKKRVMVLRIWESNIIIEPEHQPLWVGTLSMIPRTYSWLFRKKHHEISISPDLLFAEKNSLYKIKSVTTLLKRNKKIKPHTILLIQPKT